MTQERAANLLGISPDYLSQIELGKKRPSNRLVRLIEIYAADPSHMPPPLKLLEVNREKVLGREVSRVPTSQSLRTTENAAMYKTQPRMIPLLSWAQAGMATAFEEIPEDWQEYIPAVVTDKQAFAIQLRGDSMEPKYSDGDVAIVLPNTPSRAGDLVIAKIKEEGFAFKIMNLVGGGPEQIKLTSYNPLYEPRVLPREAFHWIYPVHSVNKLIRR